jgi:iron uptake system component EfeO
VAGEARSEGARVAFDLLRPALRVTGHSALATTIAGCLAAVEETLDGYRRPTALGYARYDELTGADRRTLARRIDALAEPLSTLARS